MGYLQQCCDPINPLPGDFFIKDEYGNFTSIPNTLENMARTDFFIYLYGYFVPAHIAHSMLIDISEWAKPIGEQIADRMRKCGYC